MDTKKIKELKKTLKYSQEENVLVNREEYIALLQEVSKLRFKCRRKETFWKGNIMAEKQNVYFNRCGN